MLNKFALKQSNKTAIHSLAELLPSELWLHILSFMKAWWLREKDGSKRIPLIKHSSFLNISPNSQIILGNLSTWVCRDFVSTALQAGNHKSLLEFRFFVDGEFERFESIDQNDDQVKQLWQNLSTRIKTINSVKETNPLNFLVVTFLLILSIISIYTGTYFLMNLFTNKNVQESLLVGLFVTSIAIIGLPLALIAMCLHIWCGNPKQIPPLPIQNAESFIIALQKNYDLNHLNFLRFIFEICSQDKTDILSNLQTHLAKGLKDLFYTDNQINLTRPLILKSLGDFLKIPRSSSINEKQPLLNNSNTLFHYAKKNDSKTNLNSLSCNHHFF